MKAKYFIFVFITLSFFSVMAHAFTFTDYTARPLTSAEANPWGGVMDRAMENYRKGLETAHLQSSLEADARNAELQNQLLALQLKHFLSTHPKLARDLAHRNEIEQIITRHSGLKSMFKSRSSYISELKSCASHGNPYCKTKLNEVQLSYKRINR